MCGFINNRLASVSAKQHEHNQYRAARMPYTSSSACDSERNLTIHP